MVVYSYWKTYKFPSGKKHDGICITAYEWNFSVGWRPEPFNEPYCTAHGLPTCTWIPCKNEPFPEGISSKLKRRIADGMLRTSANCIIPVWSYRPEPGFSENIIQLGARSYNSISQFPGDCKYDYFSSFRVKTR